jgi:uncharacterized protein YkwD
MSPTRRLLPCLLALGVLAAPAPAHAELREQATLDELNRVRAKHDLRPLRGSERLETSAFAFAGRLMGSGAFGHAGSILAPPAFGKLGEALALHPWRRLLRPRAVQGWLRSPFHRALILRPDFGWAGAGHARGHFRGRPATIWVLHLGGA